MTGAIVYQAGQRVRVGRWGPGWLVAIDEERPVYPYLVALDAGRRVWCAYSELAPVIHRPASALFAQPVDQAAPQ